REARAGANQERPGSAVRSRERRRGRFRPFGLPLAEEPLDAQDLQQPLEQHHLPREVFFFGLAFAGMTLPATAARAFCFLVAISASWGSLGQPTDATPAAGVRKMRRLVAPLTAAACCPHSRSLPNEGVATREPRVKRTSTIRRSASVSSRAPTRSGQSNETCASVSRLSVLASRLELRVLRRARRLDLGVH